MTKEELIKELEKRWISRPELQQLLNLPDEKAREILREIRKDYPLVNFQDARGYHISYNPTEINMMARQERARANQIYENVKVLEAWERKCGGEEIECRNKCFEFLEGLMEG